MHALALSRDHGINIFRVSMNQNIQVGESSSFMDVSIHEIHSHILYQVSRISPRNCKKMR